MATEFTNNDRGYLAWLAANPGGFVLNTTRTCSPNYMVLHGAGCFSIGNYTRMAQPGGFTARQYIKICATTEKELRAWVRQHGRPDGSFTRVCLRCIG
jgi:hypothetical protein